MINVVKRDGNKELLDIDKIHKVLEWACDGITGVSVSEIELKSQIQFTNNIKTSDIHETLIKSASELISEDTPNYQYVAGRLISYQLRKTVYGQYEPFTLKEHFDRISDLGYYDPILGDSYSDEEWDTLNKAIKHDRDNDLVYVGMEQLRSKYLVKDRVTGVIYETPQMCFMLIAMTLFNSYKEDRIKWVKDLYDALSTFDISLPTPVMAGVRTPDRQYSSCVLIGVDDSLDSITAASTAAVKYVSRKAGIGFGLNIRAEGSDIRNGAAKHTGVIPFIKLLAASIKSCSQGALRGGAATLYLPIYHKEIEDILVLKNNKGTEETRCRTVDYGIQFNKLFYERLITGGDITLFSANDVSKEMHDAFFVDPDKFKILYEKLERSTKVKNKKVVSAQYLFELFMQERKETGRIYFMNVDHMNSHGPFIEEDAPITTSNLCVEVGIPVKPLEHIHDENGEIAQCILGGINHGKIKKTSDFEKPALLLVRALNALIDHQDYPVEAGKRSTLGRRPIGIGIINYAYWLAKNGTNYSNPDLDLIHEYAEGFAYWITKASIDYAKEFGACPMVNETKYGNGIFPIDTYKKDVDELAAPVYKYDWDSLREEAIKYGIANSTLTALFPAETSSQVSNSTNGIDPIRDIVSYKRSKDGVLAQVAPEPMKLKNKYEKLFEPESPRGYISIMAVLQKFIDQSISLNTTYNPDYFPDREIPMSTMLTDLLFCYKYGIKTGYYFNEYDGSGEIRVEDIPELEQSEFIEEDCESCVV